MPSLSAALKLVAVNGDAALREIALSHLPLRLGRGETVDVNVDDRWVSREHCEIDQVAGSVVVRDLGSKHGTFINGAAVRVAELKPGDELSIGLSRFAVCPDGDTVHCSARVAALCLH